MAGLYTSALRALDEQPEVTEEERLARRVSASQLQNSASFKPFSFVCHHMPEAFENTSICACTFVLRSYFLQIGLYSDGPD